MCSTPVGVYGRITGLKLIQHVALERGRVRFRYKDYADVGRHKEMTVTADEFLRRFLLHVLPKRFVRIRHYGLLAGRSVPTKLERCRELLGVTEPPDSADQPTTLAQAPPPETAGEDPPACPLCQAPLRRTWFEAIAAAPREIPRHPHLVRPVEIFDSS